MLGPLSRKARRFWPVVVVLLVADCAAKDLAVEHLSPAHQPHQVVGDWVRLTLTYNPGAAMGLYVGSSSRVVFSTLAVVAIGVLLFLYRAAPAAATLHVTALALLVAGAAGNLLDRFRFTRGVVDFVDLGIGSARFWTFNIADVCVTSGAVLLALVLRRGAPWRAGGGPGSATNGAARTAAP